MAELAMSLQEHNIGEGIIPKTFDIQVPANRKLVIGRKRSGCRIEQVFSSKDMPKIVQYRFVGIEGVKDGSIFARYVANSPTRKDLSLAERKVDIYGNCIINDIARLFIPEGIEEFVSIGSITRDDVLRAHIEEESITGYWYVKADVEMGDELGIVYRDEMSQFNIMSAKGFKNKDPYKASVRPAVTVRLVNA